MAAVRITKAGLLVERGGTAAAVTKAGLLVELGTTQVRITQAALLVELSSIQVRITQAGFLGEYVTEGRITQAGLLVEIYEPLPPKPAGNRQPNFHAHFHRQDFDELLSVSALSFKPVRWSWRSLGGCDYAEIEASGTAHNIWHDTPRLLRAPVEIYNHNKSRVWWGYVHRIDLYSDDLIVGLSLDKLYNRAALSYNLLAPGGTSSTPTVTAWVEDADSIARFGTKDILGSISQATTEQAEAVRDKLLALYRYVAPDVRQGSGVGAKMTCRGWWHTLDWRHYSNSGTDGIAITEQVDTIITDVGEFFTGSDIVTDHDISTNEYRDGSETARQVVSELLQTPLTTGEYLQAWVTHDRLLRVKQESESGVMDWLLLPGNRLRSYLGGVPDPGSEILGWTQLRGVLPANNWGYQMSPSPMYIDVNEYDAAADQYHWTPRGFDQEWSV